MRMALALAAIPAVRSRPLPVSLQVQPQFEKPRGWQRAKPRSAAVVVRAQVQAWK